MRRYKLRIAKGIVGPAYIMVPLSEGDIDRAVFNAVARIVLGKDHVDTQGEFNRVAKIKDESEDEIYKVLEDAPKVHDPPTLQECRAVEDYVFEHLTLEGDHHLVRKV